MVEKGELEGSIRYGYGGIEQVVKEKGGRKEAEESAVTPQKAKHDGDSWERRGGHHR